MPNQWDLTGVNIEDSYQRVLQTPDGVNIYDGTGSLFTGSFTGSFYGTASWAYNSLTASYALASSDVLVYVKNQSGQNIAKGVVVRITGSNNSSDIPRVVTASYENDNNSANTLGITYQSIADGSEGYVVTEGILTGINTNAFISGQLIYLGPTGSIIGYAPVAPLHAVRLGEVIRHQSNNGSIYVRIDNGYELDELHNVRINTSSLSYGDLLVYSSSVWTNTKQLTGSYGLTGSLNITGSAIIDVSSSSEAFRITQRGGGFALVVEDDTNPDSTSFVVDSAGRVGIGYGIATPLGQALTINGVGAASTSFIAPTLQGTTLYPNNDVNLNIRTRDGGAGNRDIVFGTGNSGGTPFTRMIVSASGDVIIPSGNLGIGTTSPRSNLHVVKGSSGVTVLASDIATFENNTHAYITVLSPNGQNSGLHLGSGPDPLGAYVRWNQDNNLMSIGTANDGDNINFVTGNETSSMYLRNNIGLGIGTTAPLYRLDVSGSSRITGDLIITGIIDGGTF